MIKEKNNNIDYIEIDIGRPTFHTEEEMEYFKRFHDFVKNSKCKISINSVFNFIDELLREGKMYSGGRMKYMFWVETK